MSYHNTQAEANAAAQSNANLYGKPYVVWCVDGVWRSDRVEYAPSGHELALFMPHCG